MLINEIIEKRKAQGYFTDIDLARAVTAYVNCDVSDAEMTQFIKFIYDNGMSDEEVYHLTKIMQNSGENLDLGAFDFTVDKHSSGGVADNTTIVIVPILAALGLVMIKMSGGGLGFTGGTADKVKSCVFGGLENELPFSRVKEIIKKAGGCFLTQSEKMVPADKKIYALRDRTGYIESIPLIASSIASKKLASGAETIILDIKCGDGAFMQNNSDAEKLARCIVDILKRDGKKACAVISSMDNPLGAFVGDDLEVMEAVRVLEGKCRNNLYKLSVVLASKLLSMAKNIDLTEAEKAVTEVIESGKALAKLEEIVALQGGKLSPNAVDLSNSYELKSENEGWIAAIKTQALGFAVKKLLKENNNLLGVEICVKNGDFIHKNSTLIKAYFKEKQTDNGESVLNNFIDLFEFSQEKTSEIQLVQKIIE